MNLRQPILLAGLLVGANVAIAVWTFFALPAGANIVVGWNDLSGAARQTMPKLPGLAIFPLVALVVTAALAFAPRRSRDPEKLAPSSASFGLLITSLAALFLVAEGALVARGFDPAFDVIRWVFLAAAVLLVLVGNTLGKVRHNDIFGVRTPATLADARVWDKTHRFTGRLMVLGAAVLAAFAAFFPDHALLIATLIAVAAGAPLAGALYARRLARETPPAG